MYPKLSTLISLDDLPEELSFVKNGISSVFNKLYYKGHQILRKYDKRGVSYNIIVVCKERLSFEIPGIGLEFVLNPSYNGTENISEIPVSLIYNWKILKHIRGFKMSNFRGTEAGAGL